MKHMQSEAVEENKGNEMGAHFSLFLGICSTPGSNSRKAQQRGSLLNFVVQDFIGYVRFSNTI